MGLNVNANVPLNTDTRMLLAVVKQFDECMFPNKLLMDRCEVMYKILPILTQHDLPSMLCQSMIFGPPQPLDVNLGTPENCFHRHLPNGWPVAVSDLISQYCVENLFSWMMTFGVVNRPLRTDPEILQLRDLSAKELLTQMKVPRDNQASPSSELIEHVIDQVSPAYWLSRQSPCLSTTHVHKKHCPRIAAIYALKEQLLQYERNRNGVTGSLSYRAMSWCLTFKFYAPRYICELAASTMLFYTSAYLFRVISSLTKEDFSENKVISIMLRCLIAPSLIIICLRKLTDRAISELTKNLLHHDRERVWRVLYAIGLDPSRYNNPSPVKLKINSQIKRT